MAKKKYFIHPKYAQQEFLGVILNKRRVNLLGKDHKQTIPKSAKGPATDVIWKGATQADLAAYFALGNQRVVIEEDDSTGTSNP